MVKNIVFTSHERVVIGTLAHNRAFSTKEITEYTRFNGKLRISGSGLVHRLLKSKLIEHVGNGMYYPTSEGWAQIELL